MGPVLSAFLLAHGDIRLWGERGVFDCCGWDLCGPEMDRASQAPGQPRKAPSQWVDHGVIEPAGPLKERQVGLRAGCQLPATYIPPHHTTPIGCGWKGPGRVICVPAAF